MRQRTHQPQFAWLIFMLLKFVNFVPSCEYVFLFWLNYGYGSAALGLMGFLSFQAIHSDTGALASCKGWQTISTRVGSACARASRKTLPS